MVDTIVHQVIIGMVFIVNKTLFLNNTFVNYEVETGTKTG